jgi:sialic acid synthase SpsE
VKAASVSLGARVVGPGQPCLVVAEVGAAHEGQADTALRMIEAAFKMGADAIAFAMYETERLVVRRHPERKALGQAEFSARDWRTVLRAARASGLAVIVEAFDAPSLALAAEAEVDAFEVPSGDLEHHEWLREVAAAGRPLLLGAGGLSAVAVREALDLVGAVPCVLLFGLPAAPARAEDLRFLELTAAREQYRVPVGFKDRTDGGGAFALVAPALATAYGADLVKKPFTLDRSRKGRDYQASLAPEDFYRMVELLRQAEAARGESAPPDVADAARNGDGHRRSMVAASLISRGQVLTAAVLAYKRTGSRTAPGYAPREGHRVIGRRAARPIQADEIIREDMLE